jgi:YVTN family beta-propeller protein
VVQELERRKFLTIATAAGLTAGMSATPPTDADVLAVVEKKAGKVAFCTSRGKRLSDVKVGTFPHEMVLSPDRRLLYVTDNGLLWMTDQGGGCNTISIVDVRARAMAGVIDLGHYRRPHGIAVVPETGQLVVRIENPFGLLLIDPVGRKVLRRYEVKGQHPHMVLLGPNAETAWVSNAGSGEVAVINLASGEVENIIPVGKDPQGGVITKDGKRIYVTNHAGNTISIIKTTPGHRRDQYRCRARANCLDCRRTKSCVQPARGQGCRFCGRSDFEGNRQNQASGPPAVAFTFLELPDGISRPSG